ncbi:MAG: selenocysteine-specific translation elongation factor [Chloroflexi bacterium]|nr:selenocysteine-specific translation elongation factor [Chloroflexota bacterium]
MRVIGTAGHVDHGKSTLVSALTGINPDRLKEEQSREMTIELGFAWMTLPDGEEVGIIDVPGHRDFIENMLSGVGGIDSVIFVVAADEGIMPQTREHLAILDILNISGGVVALTKTDLVDDPEWLELVEEDLRLLLQGTVLAVAPFIRVSARKGTGLTELVAAIEDTLRLTPPRIDRDKPRLSIDRVFTIAGFGTVVTGTLMDGNLKIGDEIEILPTGLRGRVRGLQTHKKKEEVARAGTRTAVNINGIEVDQIRRGDVLTKPGTYQAVSRMDVHFKLLSDVSTSIHHNELVKIFHGAAESTARVRLLGTEELRPGQEGWLQLELDQPLVAIHGDRYILRRPSPGETLGGGEVVDAFPKRRHKRFDMDVIARLEKLQRGTPEDLLYQALLQSGPLTEKELKEKLSLSGDEFSATLERLKQAGQIHLLPSDASAQNEILFSASWLEQETTRVLELLEQFHQKYPLRAGMPREELKSRLKYSGRVFLALMLYWTEQNKISEIKGSLKKTGHEIHFNADQQRSIALLKREFDRSPYSPPSVKDCRQITGDEVYEALLATGELIQLTPEVVFSARDYERLVEELKDWLDEKGTVTVAEFRDRYQTSRRYALAFLEYMDQTGVTLRDGDVRRAKRSGAK